MDISLPISAQGPRALVLPRAFTVARVLTGCFLLITAALKIHGLTRGAVFDASSPFSPQLQVAAAEAEILVALLLLWPRYARTGWLAAIALFTLFAGTSLYLALVGQRSCGCFGVIPVNPWATFALDGALLAGLSLCRAPRDNTPSFAMLLGTAACVAVLFGVSLCAFWLLGDESVLARFRGESITVQPVVTELGDGHSGEERSFRIQLTNHTERRIRIVGGNEVPGCVPTADLPITLPPGHSSSINVLMRFSGSAGRFQRWFTLFTDNEAQPVVTSRFHGRVIEK